MLAVATILSLSLGLAAMTPGFIVAMAMIAVSLNQNHAEFSKGFAAWWWFWQGPIIDFSAYQQAEARAWLTDSKIEYKEVVNDHILKFRQKSDAAAMKLMFG